jgi:hypothetical protein
MSPLRFSSVQPAGRRGSAQGPYVDSRKLDVLGLTSPRVSDSRRSEAATHLKARTLGFHPRRVVRQSTDRIGQEGLGLDDQILVAHLGRGSHANTAEGRPSPLIRRDLSGTAGLWLSRTRVFSLRIAGDPLSSSRAPRLGRPAGVAARSAAAEPRHDAPLTRDLRLAGKTHQDGPTS